jgi:hypothetical protein
LLAREDGRSVVRSDVRGGNVECDIASDPGWKEFDGAARVGRGSVADPVGWERD